MFVIIFYIRLQDGETSATKLVAEKYQSLDKELGIILGGMQGAPAETLSGL